MPLGSAVKSTIDIDFTRAQGVNSSGRITFQPPRIRIGSTMISTYKVSVDILEGVGTIDIVRLPTGVYHVREEIDGRPPYEWDFTLPLSAPATIQYEEIAPVAPVPEYFTYVRTVNGNPPDPVTGDIVLSGSGGSVPDATGSVKGIVQLTGDLGGTAASPALSAARIAEIAAKYVKPGGGIPSSDMATAVQTSLGKADTASQPGHTHSSSQITDFTTAVDARVQLIVDAAPAALDTLNELAAALNDDPNFAATVTTALAGKQPLSTDLTEIAGLAPANNDLLQQIAGAWAVRTPAQVKTSLGLVKGDVGLSAVTNDAQVPLSLFDAAGDILVGTGNDTASKLAKGTDGTFLGVSGGSLGYYTPAGGSGDLDLYPPTAAGLKEWTADPQVCSVDFAHNNGVLLLMRMHWRQASGLLSEIGFCVTSGASGPGSYSGVALYQDGTGVVNKLGESADAGVQWTSQGPKSVALVTPVSVVKDMFYYLGILWQGSSAGRIAGVPAVILDALMNAGVRRSVYLTGQTGFPATINIGTANTNNATYWMSAK
jgi:hypothetical protein